MAFFLADAFLRANGLRIACDNRTAPGFIAGLPETGYLRLDTFLRNAARRRPRSPAEAARPPGASVSHPGPVEGPETRNEGPQGRGRCRQPQPADIRRRPQGDKINSQPAGEPPINSFQDIVDALQQDPALRDRLRTHDLTGELLQLPAQVMLLRTGVAALKAGQERLEARVGQLAAGQQRLETTTSMSGALSRIDGTSCEDHATDLAPRFVRDQLAISLPRIIARRNQRDELRIISLSATTNNLISNAQANQLQTADLVIAGQDQLGIETCVLAEISITVQQNDINRAAGRARILEKATGVTTIPAAIGSTIQEGLLPGHVHLIIIPTREELDEQPQPQP